MKNINQVWWQVCDQVRRQVGWRVEVQVKDQVGDQVWVQVWDQVGRNLKKLKTSLDTHR